MPLNTPKYQKNAVFQKTFGYIRYNPCLTAKKSITGGLSMKRLPIFLLIFMLMALVVMPLISTLTADVTNMGIVSIVDDSGKIIVGVKTGGWKWIISNWYFLLTTLVAAGFVIVRFTPSKKDDAFFNKYILGGFRLIGKIMSFGMAGDKAPPGKK